MDMSLGKLQEIMKDREAWHIVVYGVPQSRTRLKWLSSSSSSIMSYNFFLILSNSYPLHSAKGPPGLLFSSVQFSCSVTSNSLWPHGLQYARPLCPSPAPGVYSNSCPLSRWCHQAISSSVIPFSSHFQSFPAWGSFQMSQFFTLGGQSIGVSASVLAMDIQHFL